MMYLNYIYTLITLIFGFLFLFGAHRAVRYYDGKRIVITNSYMIFSLLFFSFLVSLNDASLIVWIPSITFTILLSLQNKKITDTLFPALTLYFIFIGWSVLTLAYSQNLNKGFLMLAKFLIPVAFFYITYTAINKDYYIKCFLQNCNVSIVVSVVLFLIQLSIGIHFSWIYYTMYVCFVPLVLYWLYKKRIYILFAAMSFIQPILGLKRAPILGITIAFIAFFFYKSRIKFLIPTAILIGGIFAVISSNQKLLERIFGEEKGDATEIDITESSTSAMMDHVNTSGREVFWAYMYELYFVPNKFEGCGLGTAKGFMVSDKNPFRQHFILMHNDWLHILCETGIIGVFLLLIFFFYILYLSFKYTSKKYKIDIRVIACCCGCSIFTASIHMFFANCINSIGLSVPFIFYAILLRRTRHKLLDVSYEVK